MSKVTSLSRGTTSWPTVNRFYINKIKKIRAKSDMELEWEQVELEQGQQQQWRRQQQQQ